MKEFLQALNRLTMSCPQAWGPFHIVCIALVLAVTGVFIWDKNHGAHIRPRAVFGVYGFVTLALELTKQLMWAVAERDGSLVWAYSWYSAPFQFCTMPLFISLILFFSKNEKLNGFLTPFLGLFSVISMTAVMCCPGDVFTESVLINVHTMFLHGGGLAVALFVLIRRLTPFTLRAVLKGFCVFLVCTALALALDIAVEKSGINGGETFNMFYISPYYESTLPMFSALWHTLPYPLFLLSYLAAFLAGGCFSCGIARLCARSRRRQLCGYGKKSMAI